MPRLSSRLPALAAVLAALPMFAFATPPIDQLGTFAYSCAGASSANGVPVTNIDLSSLFDPADSRCKESFSPLMAQVKAKATHAVTGSSSGIAQAFPGGKLRVRTSNGTANSGEKGASIAGFTDVLTIDAPGHTGTSGRLFYKVKVKGTLETHGQSGAMLVRVLPIAAHLVTTWKDWSGQTDWFTPDALISVDEVAVVSTNFVFGQPLTLTTTVWAISSGSNTQGSIAFDAKDSIRLKGVHHVTTYEGAPVDDYTLASQAGLPW